MPGPVTTDHDALGDLIMMPWGTVTLPRTASPLRPAGGGRQRGLAWAAPGHLQVAQIILRNIDEYWKWIVILLIVTY